MLGPSYLHLVSILASFCVWTKSLMCKDAVNRDSTCQSIFRRLYTAKKTCHPVRTPICPLFHPPGRCVHPDRTPDRPASSVRTMYLFRPDPTLYREASVPACILPDISAAHPDAYQYSNSLRFFPSSNKGKIDQPSRRCGIPSGRASP
jgi:hypothetical protein